MNGQPTRVQDGNNTTINKNSMYTTEQIAQLQYTGLPTALTYTYTYDNVGNIATYTAPGKSAVVYTYDKQGQLLSAVGNETYTYTYDGAGNIVSATGTMAEINPLRYRGYYYDAETGLYYLQSRYYNPEWGRFLNADGQLNPGELIGANLYIYCGNNPIMRMDFSGECWDYFVDFSFLHGVFRMLLKTRVI